MDFSAYDKLSIGIVAVDQNMHIMYLNEPYARFLGHPRSELIGQNFLDYVPHSKFPEVLKSGEIQSDAWSPIGDDYFLGNRVPIIEDGKVVGAIGELILDNCGEIEKLTGQLSTLEKNLHLLQQSIENTQRSENKTMLIYQSEIMGKLVDKILKVAPLDTTVLITGETGTGKEVIAETLYQYSKRSDHPLVKINCAAIPNELMESELFGYEKGSFTGALKEGKIGKFELATNGVLFLDEISSLPLNMQSKLLRVLQDKMVEPVGSIKPKEVDVKIIAATNDDLMEMVSENRFRSDLYYRLNIVNIKVPPLRERKEDILLLCDFFLRKYYERFQKDFIPLSHTVSYQLEHYSWPGNVRELKNTMEYLAIMAEGPQISFMDLYNSNLQLTNVSKPSLTEQLNEYEKKILINAMKNCDGNKASAAESLGINRTTLYSKLEKYNITDDSY